jgi:hypothetical protein
MKRRLRKRLLRLWLRICRIWLWIVNAVDLLILVRVPVLAVGLGVVAVVYVPQIRELFEISISGDAGRLEAFWACVFAMGLSVVAWYSARTLFRFRYPNRNYKARVKKRLGEWLPRVLIAAVPVAMATIYFGTAPPGGGRIHLVWGFIYLFLAAGLLWLAVRRRRIARRLGLSIEQKPQAGALDHWRDLGPVRYTHYLALAAGIGGGVVGAMFPGWLTGFGPLALLLGGMAWLVMMSTAPIHFCTRHRIPLITVLVLLAYVWTSLDVNDNHAVRLTAEQRSTQDPPRGLNYGAAGRPSLEAFIGDWWDEGRQAACDDRAWFVSSEGGGIRAAMWTVLVLNELDAATEGRLWPCTMAVSGVSGGSLGLATFAVHWRESHGRINGTGLVEFLQGDFLAPVLGSMFGADLLQRVLPGRLFTDRGQALEGAWVSAFQKRLIENEGSHGLAMPLSEMAFDREGRALPALLLNTTIVDDGRRLIQHPFASLGEMPFPGSVDGSTWFPAELPVFSAVHNSARFTLVSPAGTVRRRHNHGVKALGQVVDGGYFENSATTSLAHFIERFRATTDAEAAVAVIHISNDPGVAPFARDGEDHCPDTPPAKAEDIRGELLAPAAALLATRDARGQFARQELGERIASRADDHLWHYRLCQRQRNIPLGWTIGQATTDEMKDQLAGAEGAAQNAKNTREIARQMGNGHD